MKRDIWKCLAVAAVFGVLKTLSALTGELFFVVEQSGGLDASYLMLSMGLSAPTFDTTSLLQLTVDMFPLFLFQFLFGVRVYRHFCTAGVYFFSRQPKRAAWFLRELCQLMVLSLLYPLAMMAVSVGFAALRCRLWFDAASGFLMLCGWVLTASWLFLGVLLINLLALKLGSNRSFLVIGGGQVVCVSALLFLKPFFSAGDGAAIRQGSLLLRLNPVAHLVLSWHSSFFPVAEEKIELFWQDVAFSEPISMGVDLCASAALFLLMGALMVGVGVWLIGRQELIVNDLEEGE